ncbi:MAG: DUF1700 domain-containing protein [Oscillospiraceae bacterium]|nr:DUF1700 domain-containing protein [Oscillospiraceae bacterium]
MKKNEFLAQLKTELKKNNEADMDDIVLEYEQHFAFKMADGYSEEEISAKLGSPTALAVQFDSTSDAEKSGSAGFFIRLGLAFAALFEAMFYILFLAWDVVLAVSAVAFASLGACLIGNFNIAGLIPYMPYFGSLIFGASIMGLAVIFAVAAIYCFAFFKQSIKASVRWHKNMTSASTLPPLPWNPQFAQKTRRKLRTVLLLALAIFGACFVLGFVVLAIQAGTPGFWHHWNWFV